ncbi:hypothetical protein [Methylorubrum suomiense]|uniref:Uncharacterized protein n=1 Tax=Methylorubrum suomiense TaxID=144191 RepID=A0ABQ4V694_9HYPH|nr:hypothetical protein [Methylorubrum suomiense]GJE78067.1 hypothetical protein BGCPKDLD_4678 [Methylorubrum suomiense]
MALNNGTVADIGFASLVGSESLRMHAYSAFTLLFMMNSGRDPKEIRRHLSGRAADTGVIAKNTWESYVKGVEAAAGMFRQHAPDEVAAIFDMDAEAAVDGVRTLYEGLNITSGSDIRAWSTAGVFEPLDKAAAKAAKAAEAKAKALAKGAGAAAAFFAGNAADSSTISDMGTAGPADPVAAILAMLGTLTDGQLLDVVKATNTRLGELEAAKARPADKVAPVVADNATVDAKSALAAHFNRKAA